MGILQQSDPNLKTPTAGKNSARQQPSTESSPFPAQLFPEQSVLISLPPKTAPRVDRAHFHRQTAKDLELADRLYSVAGSSTCRFQDPEALGYYLQRQLRLQQRSIVIQCMQDRPDWSSKVQAFRLQNGRPVLPPQADQAQAMSQLKGTEFVLFTETDILHCRRNDPLIPSADPPHPQGFHEPKQAAGFTHCQKSLQVTTSHLGQSLVNNPPDREHPLECEVHRVSSLPNSALASPKTPSVFADALSNMELHIPSSAVSQHRHRAHSTCADECLQEVECGFEVGVTTLASPLLAKVHSDGHADFEPPCGVRFGPLSLSSSSASSQADRSSTRTPSAPPVILEDESMDVPAEFKVVPVDLNPKQPLKSVLKSSGLKQTSLEIEKSAGSNRVTGSLESGFTSFSPSVKRRLWPTSVDSSSPAPRRLWSSAPTELVMNSDLVMDSSVAEEAVNVDEVGKVLNETAEETMQTRTVLPPVKPSVPMHLQPSSKTTSPDLAALNAPTELPLTADHGLIVQAAAPKGLPADLPGIDAADPHFQWTLNDTVQSPLQVPAHPIELSPRRLDQSPSHQQPHRAHVYSIDAAHYPALLRALTTLSTVAGNAEPQPTLSFSLPIHTIGVTIPLKIKCILEFQPVLGFAACVAELGEVEFDIKGHGVPGPVESGSLFGTSECNLRNDQAWLLEALLAPIRQHFLCYETPLGLLPPGSDLSESLCAFISNETTLLQGQFQTVPSLYVLEAQCPELQRSLTLIKLSTAFNSQPSQPKKELEGGSFLRPLMHSALSNRSANGVRYCLSLYLSTIQRLLRNGLVHGQLNLQTMFLVDASMFHDILQRDQMTKSKRVQSAANQNETILLDSIGLGSSSVALDSRTSAFHDEVMSVEFDDIHLSPPLDCMMIDLEKATGTIAVCCSKLRVLKADGLPQRDDGEGIQATNPKGVKRPRLEPSAEEPPFRESTQQMPTDGAASLDSTWIADTSISVTEASDPRQYSDLEGFIRLVTNEVSLQLPSALSSLEWKWIRMLSHAVKVTDSEIHCTTHVQNILEPLLTSLGNYSPL
jgi:hypothetical protein